MEEDKAAVLEKEKEKRDRWRNRLRNKNESQPTRRKKYFDAVRDGLIYSCVCCKKRKFNKGVCVYDGEYPRVAEAVIRGAVGEELDPSQQVRGEYHICLNCNNKLKIGKLPALRHQNKVAALLD